MRRLLPAVMLLGAGPLSGCGLDLVCPYDPHDWYDQHNATYTMMNAGFSGDRGGFDFDPVGKAATRRNGSYNLLNGNLAWEDWYDPGYWLESRTVEGYGTVYDNGNLDLLVKVSFTDKLAATWAELLRIERYRCEGSVTRYDFEPNWTVDTPPADNAYTEYWATEIRSDTKVTMYGEYLSGNDKMVINRDCTEKTFMSDTFDFAEGGFVGTQVWKFDATGEREWDQWAGILGGSYDYHGNDEYFFDGSRTQYYGVYTKNTNDMVASWDMAYQYAGSGSGTYTEYNAAGNPSRTCDITVTANGDCTGTCDNGTSITCS
jgi:hypothetical protein